MQSFLWYDLETFGKDPRRTRIVQFAAIRTDSALNPLDEPCVLWCRPADDLLPAPGATLITGITPQQAQRGHARGRVHRPHARVDGATGRSEEHTSELQSLMRISYADFCLTKKK